MKIVLALMVLVALASAAPEKRFVLDQLQALLDVDTIKLHLQQLLDTVGSDPTEQACEKECHIIITHALAGQGCPLYCHQFQALVSHFKIVPDVTTAASV